MDHTLRVYESVFGLLPSEDNPTPPVRINHLHRETEFPLFAKLEWLNPFGSVKDRAAWAMLRDLETRGEIGGQRGLVEPTSGNTGISLAAMAHDCLLPNRRTFEPHVVRVEIPAGFKER
jgi:cysteine synthase